MAAINEMSSGRAVFGIGTGGSAVWAIDHAPSRLDELRAYLVTLRDLFDRGVASYHGREIKVDGVDHPVPLFVSAEGPRTLELAGSIADAIVLHAGTSPQAIEWCLRHIATGAVASKRDPASIEIWMMLKASIDEDESVAMASARSGLAGSARHALQSSPSEKGVPGELLGAVRRLIEQYDVSSHAKAVSSNAELVTRLGLDDFLAQQFGLIGSPQRCATQLRDLQAVGVHGVLVPAIGHDPISTIDRLGREVMPLVAEYGS